MNIFDILPARLLILPDRQIVGAFENLSWFSIILENVDGENQEVNQEDNVSEEQLRKISVGGEWKRLARNLEIKDSFIEEIDANREFRTLEDKCWQVFREYLRIHGRIGRESLNSVFVEIGKSTLKIEPPETKEEKLDESIENSG